MIRTHDNERQMTHFEAYEVESEGEDTNNNNNNAYKKKLRTHNMPVSGRLIFSVV